MFGQSFIDQKARNSQGKSIRGDLTKQPIIGAFVQIYFLIVGAGAIPIRFYLRKDYGERSITPAALAISLGLHVWYVFEYVKEFQLSGSLGIGPLLGEQFSLQLAISDYTIFWIVPFVYINFFTYYLVDVFWIKGKRHIKYLLEKSENSLGAEYSYYRGEGRYFTSFIGKQFKTPFKTFTVSEKNRRIIVEPVMSFLIGLLLFIISIATSLITILIPSIFTAIISMLLLSITSVGVLLMISSICLFLEEIGIESKKRNAVLDVFDGQKELNELNIRIASAKLSPSDSEKKSIKETSKSHPFVKVAKS